MNESAALQPALAAETLIITSMTNKSSASSSSSSSLSAAAAQQSVQWCITLRRRSAFIYLTIGLCSVAAVQRSTGRVTVQRARSALNCCLEDGMDQFSQFFWKEVQKSMSEAINHIMSKTRIFWQHCCRKHYGSTSSHFNAVGSESYHFGWNYA